MQLVRERGGHLPVAAAGYPTEEARNGHDLLRPDPLLAAAVGKIDPEGQQRRWEADRGAALAGRL